MNARLKRLVLAVGTAILLIVVLAMLIDDPHQSQGISPAPIRALARSDTDDMLAGELARPAAGAASLRSGNVAIKTSKEIGPMSATPTPTPAPKPAAGTIICQPTPANDYASCRFTELSGSTIVFYLWVPRDYDPASQRRYPLVLLLHGGGERARGEQTSEENRKRLVTDPYVQVWGPGTSPAAQTDVQRRWPSFVVVPQVVAPDRWVDTPPPDGSYTLAPEPTGWLRMAKEIVDTLRQQYAGIDAQRLYVTGPSQGGYGTWEMIERWPDEFAAAVPICGGGDPAKASRLVKLPIWAFHGADDPIVPVSGSREMIQAIRAAGGNPRYTEIPTIGHGSWTAAYELPGATASTPGLFDWLFAQHRETSAANP